MQLVFEFCSQKIQPITEAVRRIVTKLPCAIKCVSAASDAFQITDDTLESAEDKLANGRIKAFSLHPSGGAIRYSLVLAPAFDNGVRSFYLGTIESTNRDYMPIWETLLSVPGLQLVCLGFEEGVEIDDSNCTPQTFPWNEWPLVIGAIRQDPDSNPWTVRDGPEMTSLKRVD